MEKNIKIEKITSQEGIKHLLRIGYYLVNENKFSEVNNFIESIFRNTDLLADLTLRDWEQLANITLYAGKFNLANACFARSNNMEGCALVSIFCGNYTEAKSILLNCTDSPISLWCKYLLGLKTPSFFQIRNLMELTVHGLLLSKNNYLLNKIKNDLDELLAINLDAYKLIGISYYNFGCIEEARKILEECISINVSDGDLYYYLGKIYFDLNDLYTARKMVKTARELLPNHYATKMLSAIV